MKELYLLTMLYLQNALCTIDMNIPEYQYLSRSLTPEECRRLYTFLYFTSDPLTAEKNVPQVPCLQLLTRWDAGSNKWEGQSKSHVDVEHALRKIDRDDLAEWLSETVFKKLVKDVDDALNTSFSNKTIMELSLNKDQITTENTDWTVRDTFTWALLAGLSISVVLIIGRVLAFCCKRRVVKRKAKEEEIMELLSYGSLDSDQETIYECVLKNNKVDESNKIDQ